MPEGDIPTADNLTEIDAESLDVLAERLNRKLVAGLPLEVDDADLDRFVQRLRRDRHLHAQRDAERAAKPKPSRKPRDAASASASASATAAKVKNLLSELDALVVDDADGDAL